MKQISIDLITRLEGNGKIEIFLDEDRNVNNAYFRCLSCGVLKNSWNGDLLKKLLRS